MITAKRVKAAKPPRPAKPLKPPFDRSVFVNCPFDDDFLPLLHAMVFAIHDCGYIARLAIEDVGAGELRVDKIVRLIQESCYSVHDISRVELSPARGLPRFNMPFECGLAFGATRFGRKLRGQPERDLLLMTAVPYQDQIVLSDLNGQDTKPHNNDPDKLIQAIRTFLAAKKPRDTGETTRGASAIVRRYAKFQTQLPLLAEKLQISKKEIDSFDYLTDRINIMSAWIAAGST